MADELSGVGSYIQKSPSYLGEDTSAKEANPVSLVVIGEEVATRGSKRSDVAIAHESGSLLFSDGLLIPSSN